MIVFVHVLNCMCRFQTCDCLIISQSAICTHLFPWQLVTLLVEYEPVSVPLFPEGVALDEYLILRTVDDTLALSLTQGKTDVQ